MEVSGVRSSWLASAAKRRWRSKTSSLRVKAASRCERRPFIVAARRPTSSLGFATGSRFERLPSPISLAAFVTASTGLRAAPARR
jgi:hypothetical protein